MQRVDLSHHRARFLALGAFLEADLAAFTTDWLGEIPRQPTLRYDGRRG
ncbi:hypothetical protein ABZW47_27075 [Streptomyces sp. NPDC004549]